MENEVIAKGRFHWARLLVTYKNGTTIFEDRSDEYFWDNLPKEDIISLGVQVTKPFLLTHAISGSKDHNYQFLHYKKRERKWGSGGEEVRDLAFAVGVVINKRGDCHILEVSPDGSVLSFCGNVIEMGSNLKLHGIRLEEIY